MNFGQLPLRLALIAALALGLARAAHPQTDTPREPLFQAWAHTVPGAVGLALSPDGERVVVVDREGTVRCFDAKGTSLWEKRLDQTVDHLCTSRRAGLTIAYSERQTFARRVYLLDPAGGQLRTLELNAPVQTAIVSPDGQFAAVAAGKSIVYCTRAADDRVRQRVFHMDAEPRQLQFGPRGAVYVACVRPNYVALLNASGNTQWKRQEPEVSVNSISASEDGRLLAIGSEESGHVVDITAVNARNQRQWSTQRPGRGPRVRLCAAGTAVVLTYEHRVQHGRDTRFERRLAYFALNDAGSWTRGGAYSAPLYLAVDRRGAWVVALETQDTALPYLRLYGPSGERRWKYDCTAPVLMAISSWEGGSIAAYRQDGVLELVRVRQP